MCAKHEDTSHSNNWWARPKVLHWQVYGECCSEFSTDQAFALARFNRVKLDQTFIVKHVIAYSLENIVFVFFLEVAIFSYLMMVFERPTDGGAL